MKSRAIVLHSLRYGDSSLVVEVYTEELGRRTLMVHVSRSRRSSTRPSLFQPLSLLQLEVEPRAASDMLRPKNIGQEHVLSSLPYEPDKAAIGLFIAEFLYRALKAEGQHVDLFRFLHHSIVYLDECRTGYANFHIVFLAHLSRFLGFYPNLDDYAEGYCFDLSAACFTPLLPREHSHYIGPDESRVMFNLMRLSYATMHLFPMNRTERARCLKLMDEYYRLHLPEYPEIKSLEVLQQVFDH